MKNMSALIKPIRPEHKKILEKIRRLYIESGGKPLYKSESWGLNDTMKSENGIEVDFDYGLPCHLFTRDGFYMILGSSVVGDLDKFWELFNQEFDVEIVKPKRDDRITEGFDIQTQVSGPIVRIKEKN